MLALLLYIWLGPRMATAEIMVEFVLGAAIVGGGGGGKRLKRSAKLFLEQLRRRHAFAL